MKTLQQLEQLEKLRHDTGLRGEMLLLTYDARYLSSQECEPPHWTTLGYYRVHRADLYKEVAPVEVRTIEFG